MSISVVRLGSPRRGGEGLRLGTVRRPPRGVPKTEFSKRNYYDIWLPQLAPSVTLLDQWKNASTEKQLVAFRRQFRAEMSTPDSKRLLDFLAALSHQTNLSVGCYCSDESKCHRGVLRQLLNERSANVVAAD